MGVLSKLIKQEKKILQLYILSDLFQNSFHQNVDGKLLHSLLLVKLLVLVRLAFSF